VAAAILLRCIKLLKVGDTAVGIIAIVSLAVMFTPGLYRVAPIRHRLIFGFVVMVCLFAYSFYYGIGWSK
jgi:hypothetical protein